MLALVVVLAEDFELLPFLSVELLLPLTFAVSTTTSGVPFRSGGGGVEVMVVAVDAAPLISGFSELPVVALLVDVVAVPVVPVPFVPVLTNTKSTAS